MLKWISSLINPAEVFEPAKTSKNAQDQILTRFLGHSFQHGDRCVYIHRKENGDIFFVGTGTVEFANSDTHPKYWGEFVKNELGNKYSVEILMNDISSDSAVLIKNKVLELYADELINTINFSRKFDLGIFKIYQDALSNYEKLFANGSKAEKLGDVKSAVNHYELAYDEYIQAMNSRNYDAGEMYLKAHSPPPPSKLIDRLSLCLLKENQYLRLIDLYDRYSHYFMREVKTTREASFIARVAKAKEKLSFK